MITVDNENIYLKADTMTVKQGFELLDRLCKGNMWYWDRWVIKEGKTYHKFGITFNKRKKTYLVQGHKLVRVEI